MKSAKNLKMNRKPSKNTDAHASRPAMGFDTSNPDKAADRRVKVAKGLMVKR